MNKTSQRFAWDLFFILMWTLKVKEKYQLYKERLEQALALTEGNAPAEKSAVEQKPPTENSVMEEKPHDEPFVEQEPVGDESTC